MPNFYHGNGSTPEQDAYVAGTTERYQVKLNDWMAIIESLPLAFQVKNNLSQTSLALSMLQRFCEMSETEIGSLGFAHVLWLVLGRTEAMRVLVFLGYQGFLDNWDEMDRFLRTRMVQAIKEGDGGRGRDG